MLQNAMQELTEDLMMGGGRGPEHTEKLALEIGYKYGKLAGKKQTIKKFQKLKKLNKLFQNSGV
jgi:hypothetical protein